MRKDIFMKFYFKQPPTQEAEEDLGAPKINLKDSIEKTRQALENAYTGFNNALDVELIDSYIYEIKSLQNRYTHLVHLFCVEDAPRMGSDPHSPVVPLVREVLG